jgi:NADPH:quinone reductase-like Zn-dependent oxidoreductase
MHGLLFNENYELEVKSDLPIPKPGKNQALIKILAVSLNRRDFWITQGLYPNLKVPVVLGSDFCGVVEALGPDTSNTSLLGKKVIANPSFGWGDNEETHSLQFKMLGSPLPGAFSEYFVIDIDRLHLAPEHLTPEQASCIPVAGVTAFRAVYKKGNLKPGQKVLITGIGGGVSQFAAQFSVLGKAEVWVTSGDNHKVELAKKKIGITGGINYKTEGWEKALLKRAGGQFDLIIDGSGGPQFDLLLKLLKPGGAVVTYGATNGKPESFDLFRVFLIQLKILGTTMGSDKDFKEMMEFISKNKLVPLVDINVNSLADLANAIKTTMKDGTQFGKIVGTLPRAKL